MIAFVETLSQGRARDPLCMRYQGQHLVDDASHGYDKADWKPGIDSMCRVSMCRVSIQCAEVERWSSSSFGITGKRSADEKYPGERPSIRVLDFKGPSDGSQCPQAHRTHFLF